MNQSVLDDCRWLTSDHAERFLRLASDSDSSLNSIVKSLRKDLSQTRTHLVVEQVELRKRARVKFERAEEMFFTRKSLEQATDERLATYKAQRFASSGRVADLCCGIGGDLCALAQISPTTGFDEDPVVSLFARENCSRLGIDGAKVVTKKVDPSDVGQYYAWHIDPDRRVGGQRRTNSDFIEPNQSWIESSLQGNPEAAIKLAPATVVSEFWKDNAELEWIGNRRECKQLVAWFGSFGDNCGKHVATVISDKRNSDSRLVGVPSQPYEISKSVQRFVFDPHSSVCAARLVGELANQFSLFGIGRANGYLTGNELLQSNLFSTYEVIDVEQFDIRRLNRWLRNHRVGKLEVKQRGTGTDAEDVRKKLTLQGDESATLLLTVIERNIKAILARRPTLYVDA